jgi:hypothetical protein
MINTDPLWQLSATPKYGNNNDYEVERLLVIFKNQGICSYSKDPNLAKALVEQFNTNSNFTHPVFDRYDKFLLKNSSERFTWRNFPDTSYQSLNDISYWTVT